MSLVNNVQLALSRVATEVNALKLQDSTLAEALLQLQQAIEAVELDVQSRAQIIVSATPPENPQPGQLWLDISGG